jgi:hypothetical protein
VLATQVTPALFLLCSERGAWIFGGFTYLRTIPQGILPAPALDGQF